MINSWGSNNLWKDTMALDVFQLMRILLSVRAMPYGVGAGHVSAGCLLLKNFNLDL